MAPGGLWRRRWLALIGAGAALAALLTTSGGASATVRQGTPLAAGTQPLTPAAIRFAQDALVTKERQPAVNAAAFAVAEFQIYVNNDQQTLANGEAAAAHAQAVARAAGSRLSVAQAVQGGDTHVDQVAKAQVITDRNRLGAIAVKLYTGGVTDPQFTTVQNLEADQQVVIDADEIQLVAKQVDKDLHSDISAAGRADRALRKATATVAADDATLAADLKAESGAQAQVPPEVATLDSARVQLGKWQGVLAAARHALQAQLVAVAGPASDASGISVMGPSVLNAGQLSAWFNARGYVDLTPATISQLAAWYVQEGAVEGVRGDVAFAQAMLETGGFDSPDAIGLNNYAGIGHCDSCSAGWDFPSPRGGVLGQVQLLRIFASAQADPPSLPGPVLPALAPAQEGRRGCCQTWESLTGIWATDPTYGAQILSIYQQMLAFAGSMPTR
ncbi:MAG TPA: glucosaminidase domain-containing protein [Acidimicrobiales bacterium]|nr:glucosaminidase domain-containing protein [Acidimicrobiales bacterium]